MQRRLLLGAGIASIAYPALAQNKATGILAVNDGVSYKGGGNEADERYAQLAKDLNKAFGTRLVIERIATYGALAAGLKSGAYDMAFVHPAHHAIAALTSGQYHLAGLSKAHINYKASFLVRKDTPLTAPAQLAGKTLYMPDADSITAWMVRATIAEVIPDVASRPKMVSVKYQDAIRFVVENKMADAGATAAGSEIKEWVSSGHKVLFATRSVPIKQFLVNSRMKSQLDGVATFLAEQKDTAKISVPDGFSGFEESVLVAAGKWLQKGALTV